MVLNSPPPGRVTTGEEGEAQREGGPSTGLNVDSKDVQARYSDLAKFIDEDLDPNRKLNKPLLATLKNKITSWAIAQAELVGKIKQLKNDKYELKKALQEAAQQPILKSYAATVSSITPNLSKTESTIKKVTNQKTSTLFIISKKGESGKKVQEIFTKTLNPAKDKIRIKTMRTTNKALIVETEDESDLNKIKINKEIAAELKCETPQKKLPLIIMYDIPTSLQEEELTSMIHEQNFEEMDKNEFAEQLKIRFKTGPRGKPTVHIVAEVQPQMRKMILNRGKLFIGFRSINIRDYVVVPRCARCQDLGHVGKHCSQDKTACRSCGDETHGNTPCKEKVSCIPCTRRGKKCSTNSKDCQTYKFLMERLISRTDYG